MAFVVIIIIIRCLLILSSMRNMTITKRIEMNFFFGHLLRERELEEPPIYSFLRLVAGFCHAKIDNSIPPTGIVCVSAIVTHSFIPPDIYFKGV